MVALALFVATRSSAGQLRQAVPRQDTTVPLSRRTRFSCSPATNVHCRTSSWCFIAIQWRSSPYGYISATLFNLETALLLVERFRGPRKALRPYQTFGAYVVFRRSNVIIPSRYMRRCSPASAPCARALLLAPNIASRALAPPSRPLSLHPARLCRPQYAAVEAWMALLRTRPTDVMNNHIRRFFQ